MTATPPGITLVAQDKFGTAVALGDGVLAVGVVGDDTNGESRGAVYIIADGGNNWADIVADDVTKLSDATDGISIENYAEFGTSVAFDYEDDGSGLLAIGARHGQINKISYGAVYLIGDGGDNWRTVAAGGCDEGGQCFCRADARRRG